MQSNNPHLILGVTAGVAAYKSLELVRILIKNGWEVDVILSPKAQHLIHPSMFQSLIHKNVWCEDSTAESDTGMPHIQLSRNADAILISPATANFIAKLAHGIADNTLLTTVLAKKIPLIVAPSMNKQMWNNPATQRNIDILKHDGVDVIAPDTGEQACGEYGIGRSHEARVIFEYVRNKLVSGDLFGGKKILITAGPTIEKIDAVRYLTNRSSGKMGYSLAETAYKMGAEVTLVSGPTHIPPPPFACVIKVQTSEEMYSAVNDRAKNQDIFISAAAVSDYTPVTYSDKKTTKKDEITIKLRKTADILALVAKQHKDLFCVGFCCETDELDKNSERKRIEKNARLMVGNLVRNSIGKDSNSVVLYDEHGKTILTQNPKIVVAQQIMQHIYLLMAEENNTSQQPKEY
ncbi:MULTISPECIES: bifunctional phosphopantothenoylcysteine decarboxylase/phosphopantothenate--cysteine ligase CoaBC [Candidatus Ichthyocystis]|uniref:Coenzyme A biosynthesis bifunctional protein CoaBC n=1 Tax=Candidatus Ichthyocystis hellenicum TaxID=1561003 RepID=A0A0S4M359_9BURK|nr:MULTISPECIES: bifunctional phosphopantothenoylcysteine decarboxylase/phosphopantothenate--cysteine ligase CoaBC [Ichthyocystis]CUT18215.1 phosphopantothenoylcysteine decarboxylase [Candidatus Ichthyocystis hellenicum]